MLSTLKNTCPIFGDSYKFISITQFGFSTFSFCNSDNNRALLFYKLRVNKSCSISNESETDSVQNVGIRIVDFSNPTFNRPLKRSKFYMITYCSFFIKFKYKVGFLIKDKTSYNINYFINYLVYILNIRFNLTGRYFYTDTFHSDYLQRYKFFTLNTSPKYIKIYLVNKDNYEIYVNLLTTGGLYVLDYEAYPLVIKEGKLNFPFDPISYRKVPSDNRLRRKYSESFTTLDIEMSLTSDYDNKFFTHLITRPLNFSHWDLTQEGYISYSNRSTFFSCYYKNSLEGFTIEYASKDIRESPKPLTSSIFYLVKALNMRFNVSGRYFYYEGLAMSIGKAKFYPRGFRTKEEIPYIFTYELRDSNLKDFLIVLDYGTKKLDLEYLSARKLFREYDGPVAILNIDKSNTISKNLLEYYFHCKLDRFMENQFRPNIY